MRIKLLCAAFASVLIVASAAANVFLIPGFTLQGSGDPTVGLLPADRSAWTNWKMAGLQSVGGISAIDATRTNCTTEQAGVTMPIAPIGGGSDDTNNIQTAVNNCPMNTIINLAVGTFTFGEGNNITITAAQTIRGSGACAGTALGVSPYASSAQSDCTLIQRTNGVNLGDQQSSSPANPHFIMGPAGNYSHVSVDAGTNLTADGAAGGYTVSVASTSGFSAGQFVLVDEASGLGWQPSWIWAGETQWSSADYRLNWKAQNPTCQTTDEDCQGGSTNPGIPCYFGYYGSNAECDMYTKEIKQIASVGSGTITFDSPLTISYRIVNTAHVVHIYGGASTPFSTYVGIENLTVQNADGSQIIMGACAYCWIKNVEVTIGAGYFTNGQVALEGCFRCEINGSLIWKGTFPYPGGDGYNISIDLGSSEVLIQDSISMLNDKVMVVRESGAGSVVAYNYFDESILGGGSGETEVGANASHWIGSHHVLFEGNWTYQLSSDPVWGPSTFITWLRNDVTGYRTPFYDYADAISINDLTSTPGSAGTHNDAGLVALALYDYWNTFVGNVLGTSGAMSGWGYYGSGSNQVWVAGDINNGGGLVDNEVWTQQSGASACTNASDQCPTIRLSNYDYVTNSLADPSNPPLPNSFFLSGAPAYFSAGSGYAWPWVNSQGTTKVQSGPTTPACTVNVGGPCSGLPAKARFDAGTPFVQP